VPVEDFVRSVGDVAVDLLRDGVPDAGERHATVKKLLSETFDLEGIGRLSLGRFWRVASEEERAAYQPLFAAFLVNLFANNMERDPSSPPLVTGFVVDKVRLEPQEDGRPEEYVITSHFERPAGPSFRVEWRVRGSSDGFRVADIRVEGFSLIVLFRQMLANQVRDGGGTVAGLNKQLRKMTETPELVALPAAQSQ
jgi:phospholipid transport system substrate-binding protein